MVLPLFDLSRDGQIIPELGKIPFLQLQLTLEA